MLESASRKNREKPASTFGCAWPVACCRCWALWRFAVGGQKQRVAIASAIAANKEILSVDEPTSGLDYVHMRQTADALQALRDLGKTILVITHDVELIALCADNVVRMDDGRIAESYCVNVENVPRLVSFFLNQPAQQPAVAVTT